MKTLKTTFISLPVLAMLLVAGNVDEAQARIRVRASLRTPHVGVLVDNGAYPHARSVRRAMPVRHYEFNRITPRDRKMAKRLGRYTGVPRRELIHLRRQGYTWREIGRWLGVPRKAVRAARTQATWRNFLDRHRYGRYTEIGGYWDD